MPDEVIELVVGSDAAGEEAEGKVGMGEDAGSDGCGLVAAWHSG